MYDGLNVGKRNVTLNLKHPEAVALVQRLVVEWADAVAENFAPRAMKGFGLDYDTLAAIKPDLVMISACLNGQTGPHKDYPGFGGQGSALVGLQLRSPAGPTASRSARTARSPTRSRRASSRPRSRPGCSTAAAPGSGVYLDLSQVESAIWTLAPWLLDYEVDGVIRLRDGNRSPRAVPHGAFPCADEGERRRPLGRDRVLDRRRVGALAAIIGVDDPALATLDRAARAIDEVEAAVGAWTRTHARLEVAEQLQAAGIEAVPVQDFGDLHDDPQLAHREHFVPLDPPVPGRRASTSATASASPTRRAATTGPARRSARTTTGCSASSSASRRRATPRADGAVDSAEPAAACRRVESGSVRSGYAGIARPPSITRVWPVQNLASSLAKNTAAPARSSGSSVCFIAVIVGHALDEHLGHDLLRRLGHRDAGRDAVDRDVVLAELRGHELREADDAPLRDGCS